MRSLVEAISMLCDFLRGIPAEWADEEGRYDLFRDRSPLFAWALILLACVPGVLWWWLR